MFLKFILLYYLPCIIFNTVLKYEKLVIEPFSILERNVNYIISPDAWFIKLNIIFGSKVFVLEHRNDVNGELCDGTRCIRAKGVTIEYKINTSSFLNSHASNLENRLVALNDQQQVEYLDELEEQIEDLTVIEYDYLTLSNFLEGPVLSRDDILFSAKLYQNRIESTGWYFLLFNARLLKWPSDDDSPTLLDGSPYFDDSSTNYLFTTTTASSRHTGAASMTNTSECEFNRKVLKIYFCSVRYNDENLCNLFTRVIEQNIACGEKLEIENKVLRIEISLWIRISAIIVETFANYFRRKLNG